jgi:WD40 repeat protein
VATGGTSGILRVWDYYSSKPISTSIGHSGCILSIAFSPDDRQIISVAEDGSIIIWSIFSAEEQKMGK